MNKQLHLKSVISKQIRYESHLDFLSKCVKSSVIPNGFNIKWKIQVDASEEEIDLCRKVKEDASLKLLEISKTACERKALQLGEEVKKLCCDVDSAALEDINTWRKGEKAKLDAVKTKKWQSLLELNHVVTSNNDSRIINIARDGNCFYRCLSHIFYGTQFQHERIRCQLTDYMHRRKDNYSHLVDGDIDKHISNQTFTDGRISSWATEAELQAAADYFKCVLLVSKDREFRIWHRFVNTNSDISESQVRIYLLLENHHFSLVIREKDQRKVNVSSSEEFTANKLVKNIDWFDNPINVDSVSVHERSNQKEPINEYPGSNVTLNVKERMDNRDKNVTYNSSCTSKDADLMNEILSNNSGTTVDNGKKRIKHWQKRFRNKNTLSKQGSNRKENKVIDGKKQPSIKSGKETSVVNKSRYPLSEPQIALLDRGLKFVPSKTKVDKIKLLADLSEWERRMRLKEFFFDYENNDTEEVDIKENMQERLKTKKNNHFTPNSGRDKCLDLYIELVKTDIVNSLKKNHKLNISREEQEAFYELLHNDDIVIRPADKGSGVVVLNKSDYIESLEAEISSDRTYEKTDLDRHSKSLKEVKKLVNKMFREGSISKEMKQYLIPRYSRPGKLKGNPKIHKPNTPFRAIVSGIGTATERLGEIAEQELNEFVENSPSYIRDTTDFINKLSLVNESVSEDCILFCFDVTKLYPSIPKSEGMIACREALDSRTYSHISTENVLQMIQTVLDNNTFSFGESAYIQKEGVAIGSKLGKNFACTYMRKWDEKLMSFEKKPLFYKRYIDDGFGIWRGTESELVEFTKHANGIHPNIKVELRYSRTSIEFLDTIVRIEDNKLVTDLYVKPTDKQLYLDNSSCHPPNTKKALAYGLALRLKRICQKDSDYKRERGRLKNQLRKRGYSGKMIEQQLQKADKLDRSSILNQSHNKKTPKQDRVPMVVTYSKSLPNIHKIMKKHSSVLYDSERLRKIFLKLPMVAFRRDKNLCDVLVHGKTNRLVNASGSVCTNACNMCTIIENGSVSDTTGQVDFNTVRKVGCTEKNVVYGIKCERCNKMVYVGETEREIRERMKEHLSDVRHNRDKPINTHFNGRNHCSENLRFVVLQRMFDAGRTERQMRETIWIRQLKTYKPFGCNCKLDSTLI